MQCTPQVMEFRRGLGMNLNKSFIVHQDPDILTSESSKPAIFYSMPWPSPDAHSNASFSVETRTHRNWRESVHTLILSYYGVKPQSWVADLDPENWNMYQPADIGKCILRNSWIRSTENCILRLEHKFCNYLFSNTRLSSNSYAP